MHFTQATFLADPPTFILAGLIASLIFRAKSLPIGTVNARFWLAVAATSVFMAWFILTQEYPCYFDRMAPPGFSSVKTCNEFMWHGYVDWPGRKPPIPSYRESWSTAWLIEQWTFQVLCGLLTVYAFFKSDLSRSRRTDP